jgi:hypothetical protein
VFDILLELETSLEGTTTAAIASFAGFVVSMVLYTTIPFAKTGVSWQTPASWLSVVLVGAGLVCFVVFLVTGLITFFNRGYTMPPREPLE